MEDKRILIADEDQKFIVRIKEILATMGYDVSFAIDGAVALTEDTELSAGSRRHQSRAESDRWKQNCTDTPREPTDWRYSDLLHKRYTRNY